MADASVKIKLGKKPSDGSDGEQTSSRKEGKEAHQKEPDSSKHPKESVKRIVYKDKEAAAEGYDKKDAAYMKKHEAKPTEDKDRKGGEQAVAAAADDLGQMKLETTEAKVSSSHAMYTQTNEQRDAAKPAAANAYVQTETEDTSSKAQAAEKLTKGDESAASPGAERRKQRTGKHIEGNRKEAHRTEHKHHHRDEKRKEEKHKEEKHKEEKHKEEKHKEEKHRIRHQKPLLPDNPPITQVNKDHRKDDPKMAEKHHRPKPTKQSEQRTDQKKLDRSKVEHRHDPQRAHKHRHMAKEGDKQLMEK